MQDYIVFCFLFFFCSKKQGLIRLGVRKSFEGKMSGKAIHEKEKKLDTSFKKVVGGSLKLKGVEFKGWVGVLVLFSSDLCSYTFLPPHFS